MKILDSLRAGIFRSVKLWKAILIIWFVSLILACLVALPMKASVQSGLANSTITEKLKDGFNTDVFKDMGTTYSSLIAFFSRGLLILTLAGFLINSFFAGGLFNGLKGETHSYTASEFFQAATGKFWSYLVISFTLAILILLMAILLVIIPVGIVSHADIVSDEAVFRIGVIGSSIFLFSLIILLLVADFARAWQAVNVNNKFFKALGFGFSQTFRTFFSCYPVMLIVLIIQLIFVWFVARTLTGLKPVTEGGIIFLFLLSQILFIIRLLLKAWRYGSITRIMELSTTGTKEL